MLSSTIPHIYRLPYLGLLLCLTALFATQLQAVTPNLLTNPGFESGLMGWANHSGGTAQVVTTSPYSGVQAGRSTNRTTVNQGLRYPLLTSGLVTGKCYIVSGWVRTASVTPVTINMSVQQTDNYGSKFNSVKTLQVADSWTFITGLYQFNVNGPLTVLNLYFNGPPIGVDLFVDEVSFCEVDSEAIENLLTNPGFENGTTGWAGHGLTTVTPTAFMHTGTSAAAVGNRTAVWNGIEQSLFGKTEDGRMYYGAGWVKTDSATAESVKLRIEVIDSSGSRVFTFATGTATSDSWTWLSGYITLPITTGLTNVKFFAEGPTAGVSMQIDNCYFAPVTGLRRASAAYPALRLGSGGLDVAHFAQNEKFRSAISAHFHLSSSGNAGKFANTEPSDNIWTFANANAIIDMGLARGGSSRGHTFLWHNGVPNWASTGAFTAPELQAILWDQIDTKGAYFRGRLPYWDAANEVIDESNGVLRSSLWYDTPGIGYVANGNQYIREAFTRARAADPETLLFYNDYNIEEDNTKSDAVHSMLSSFVSAGIPVQGIGFQSHFVNTPNAASVRTNFQRFQDLGLDLHVTELDIRLPVDANGFATPASLNTQGDGYFSYLGTALGYSRMKVFQTWGVYDGVSWIPGHFPGFGQALPLDFNFDRKPAYWGMWNALSGQCEKLTLIALSSGDTQSNVSDTRLSANSGKKLSADAANDSITLQAHVPFSGQWNVKLGVLKLASGGRFQLAAAPPGSTTFTNIGAVQDTYAGATVAAALDLGTVSLNASGDWQFRCTITGKNGSATDFDLTLDYLRLTPITCDPRFTMPVTAQSISLNTALAPKLFMAEDDTAEGSLSVTATSSNTALVPTNNVIIKGTSPYYTLAATPLADRLGTTTLTLSANDGVRTTTNAFTLTVTGTAIQTWRMQNFGTTANSSTAADNADPDNDGISNLLEYATKMNPSASDTVQQSAAKNGSVLDFIYTKSIAATDVTYSVEWSDTLGNDWTTASVSAPTILNNNGITQQIKVTIPAGSGVMRRFVRLKVTRL
jgi:endo-1,4-beta-xylanase